MLVKLWDTKTGKVLFTLDSHEGTCMEKCFSLLQAILSPPISFPIPPGCEGPLTGS